MRVDIRKGGGLFNKIPRLNQYAWIQAAGSGSNGLDLMKLRSNLERWFRIGRTRFNRARGGGGMRRRRAPAAGDHRCKPNPAFPGSIRVAVGSRSIGGIRVTHLCPQVGGLRLGWGLAVVQAALAHRRGQLGAAEGERGQGTGTACSLPSCDADAGRRSRREAA